MGSVLAEVQKLIALSQCASASENEARNASLAACRLIVKYKMEIVLRTTSHVPDEKEERSSSGSGSERKTENGEPLFFRWEHMTDADRRRFGVPMCGYANGTPCLQGAEWMLCTPDRTTVKGNLCGAHMAELAAQAPEAPHRTRPRARAAAAPERPIDLARAASDAATEALGTAGEAIGRAAGQRLVKGLKNVLRGR